MKKIHKGQMSTEDFYLICKTEWEKALKKLKRSTPKGQIRFTLLNYGSLKRKLIHKTKLSNTEALLHRFLIETTSSSKLYVTFSFLDFPPYISEAKTMDVSITYHSKPLYEVLLVFYANDLGKNPDCAKDLIIYWFENFVLPLYKKSRNTSISQNLPLVCHTITKTYSYAPLAHALCSFEYSMNNYQYKEILDELCGKHNCRLATPTSSIPNTISLC